MTSDTSKRAKIKKWW